ncbi:tripartite tricarboxylate transporter TctB family protein [Vreelandella sp. GE22]
MYKKAIIINNKNTINLAFLVIGCLLIWNGFFNTGSVGSENMIANSSSGSLTDPLSLLWVAMASIIFIKDIFGKISRNQEDNSKSTVSLKLITIMALISLIVWITPILGFFIVITTFLPLLLFLIGTKGKWQITIATIILGPAIWFLFHHLLSLRLPTILPGGIF